MSTDRSKILPIGTYFQLDTEGYILNETNIDKLSQKWREALEDMVHTYTHYLGKKNIRSIIVRGSVARGEPVDDVSDIDTIAIVYNASDVTMEWAKTARSELREKFPFSTGFEFVIWDSEKVENPESTNMRFVIKTQTRTIFGEDIGPSIEPFKPDSSLAISLLKYFETSLEKGQKGISLSTSNTSTESWCRWIAKQLVRAGFYLVMPRAGTFTKDLYPSHETFATYYPTHKADMYKALSLAINPVSDKKELLAFVEEFGGWMNSEILRLYRNHS